MISLLPIYIYLGLRLGQNWFDWFLIALPFLTIISFPSRKKFRYQLHLSYASMGLLTYLPLFAVLRDIVWLTSDYLAPVSYVLGLTLTANLIGYIEASKGPLIKEVIIPLLPVTPELEGLTIAQISDLHIGHTIRKNYVEKVVMKINSAQPDVIVLTGDIGDGNPRQYKEDAIPLKELQSNLGTFFVPGNHEYYWNVNEWLTVMNNMGIINLVNRGKVVTYHSKKILIAGIPDPVSRLAPELGAVQEADSSANADYKILLSHRPGIAQEASRFGFHLQLSGHTHGGQFFPWTLVVKLFHKLSLGLHRVGDMWLYISPGTGSWGPLLRLGTKPEITLLILTSDQRKNLSHH